MENYFQSSKNISFKDKLLSIDFILLFLVLFIGLVSIFARKLWLSYTKSFI